MHHNPTKYVQFAIPNDPNEINNLCERLRLTGRDILHYQQVGQRGDGTIILEIAWRYDAAHAPTMPIQYRRVDTNGQIIDPFDPVAWRLVGTQDRDTAIDIIFQSVA